MSLSDVQRHIARNLPANWELFNESLAPILDRPLPAYSELPLAAASAVGGSLEAAIPVAAAWTVLQSAVRILDDIQDRDRPLGYAMQLGPARATNVASAMLIFTHRLLQDNAWEMTREKAVLRLFQEEALLLAQGQDMDLQGNATSMDDYWRLMEGKNGRLFSIALGCGALTGSLAQALISPCYKYGLHLGLMHQALDDYQGMWEPEGAGDLMNGKVTLPLIYALTQKHQHSTELLAWIRNQEIPERREEILSILDEVNAREFTLWTAKEEATRACEQARRLPGIEGRETLIGYIETMLGTSV